MKKFWIQTQQQIKSKLGKAEKTEDEEFNELQEKFYAVWKSSKHFHKHVNQFIENFHAFSTTLSFLSEDVRDVNADQTTFCSDASKSLEEVSQSIEKGCVHTFQNNVTEHVVNPIGEYIAEFEPLEKMFKERKNALLQYDYHRERVEKLSEKQSKNSLDLPRAKEKMEEAKKQYDDINDQCKQQMRDLVSRQNAVFEPAIQQTSGNLLEYFDHLYRSISGIQSISDSVKPASQDHASQQKEESKETHDHHESQQSGSSSQNFENLDWFYVDENVERQGPFSFSEMKSKYHSGEISNNTHVFAGEMDDWEIIDNIPGLKEALH